MKICRKDEGTVRNIADAGGRRYVAARGGWGETNNVGVGQV